MKRIARFFVSSAFVVATSTAATASSICDDLWFTRNWVMSQAGYCFGSVLGMAQFDNTRCTGQNITLSPVQTAFVTEVRRRETVLGCSVDTGRTTLRIADVALRKRLQYQPMRHEGDNMEGWGCLGFVGPEVSLRSAPRVGAEQVGHIVAGDWVSIGGYEPVDGWTYVMTYEPNWGGFRSGGWMHLEQSIRCEAEAG